MTQPSLFDTQPRFDGATFDRVMDQARLASQLISVREYMLRMGWQTLAEIHNILHRVPEASISARLRDLRKTKFGGYTVDRRRRSPGTFEYRVRT